MNKFLFINIPKNASTSLYEAFKDYDAMRSVTERMPPIHGMFHPRHRNLAFAKENLIDFENLLIIGCVRNPFDRIVSAYEFARTTQLWRVYQDKEPEFPEFVQAYCERSKEEDFFHAWSQTKWLSIENKIRSDIILEFENLKEDYESLAHEFELNLPQLPQLNGNSHEAWQTYYDRDTKFMVIDSYQEDFENFNYREEI